MAEEKSYRLARIAGELGIGVHDLIEHFKALNIELPDTRPTTIIDVDSYKLLLKSIKLDSEGKIIKENPPKLKGLSLMGKIIIPDPIIGKKVINEDIQIKKRERKFPLERNSRKDSTIIENTETKNQLKPYFELPKNELVKLFKDHNSINSMLFEGKYRKVIGQNFGFFRNPTYADGGPLYYPITGEFIKEIFVGSSSLTDGSLYQFEATIANPKERIERGNPFLLQAAIYDIEEIKRLSALTEELLIKEASLKVKTKLLDQLDVSLKDKGNIFNELDFKLNKMLELASSLRERIELCRNLQFITELDENRYVNLLSPKPFEPLNHLNFEKDFEKNFSKLSDHIHAYLYHKKNLIYTRYQIRNFLTLLKTHDLIVLSGLSGSGKTQIVKAFAEALGGIAKIIPVKPNWTSSDDLIGYYNPLQMSFLPTPFTEAIAEAINNPNQLYFICLDEMNLARVEYYFADFLSKLEERSKQPEVELYANHEEELFVSEFSTLLNLIESSIKGKKIESWQEFLDDEEARKKFFEMLGNTDKESMLQLHSKMKRRLIDILKFPSTIRIPDNVRFIGAINVDETTHYFSPKILDRIHVVKFDNPLLFEEQVNSFFEDTETDKYLKPVYVNPILFSQRIEFPPVNNKDLSIITQKLKEINQNFLLPLNIDFGIRSIRQSLNYAELNKSTYDNGDVLDISLNTIILQKIFPRFIFDGSEIAKNGKSKIEVVEDLHEFLENEFGELYDNYESDEMEIGKVSNGYLHEMIEQAKRNNSQFNFFA